MKNLVIKNVDGMPFVPKPGTIALFIPRNVPYIYYEGRVRELKLVLKTRRMSLLYLPELVAALTSDVLRYNIPNCSKTVPDWEHIQLRFEEALGIEVTEPVCILFEKAEAYMSAIDDVASLLEQKDILRPRRKRKLKPISEPELFETGGVEPKCHSVESPIETEILEHTAELKKCETPDEKEIRRNEKEGEEVYVLNRRLLKRLNIGIDQIQALIDEDKKLSRLHITSSGRIILEDYSREIKVDDLSTAFYMLFIKHEEGINLKDLQDHYLELLDYYQSVSGRENKENMENTIARLVIPGNNSVNVLISRIKREFLKAFDFNIAEKYFIQGKQGKDKFIALDRSLVIWDAVRR